MPGEDVSVVMTLCVRACTLLIGSIVTFPVRPSHPQASVTFASLVAGQVVQLVIIMYETGPNASVRREWEHLPVDSAPKPFLFVRFANCLL